MHFEELNTEIRDFCDKRNWEQYHTPKDLGIGLVTESSELLELFRFKGQDDQVALLQDPQRREDVEEELADVLFFVLRFADLYDIDLERALAEKLEANRAKYPEDEYKGSNKKYDQ